MDITIYQINMGRDHNRIAFEGLDLLKMYQGSDKIDSRIYDRVFEGEVDCKDLEDVYRKFNLEHPEGYKGRSLSVSDVVEIVDENGDSTFHFCDSIGFKQIDFDLKTITDTATEYVEGIFQRLREHEYNPELMRLYVLGGGSCLIRNFGTFDKERVTINDDICATAKGYEYLAELNTRKGGHL